MNGSFKVGNILGIDIEINYSWLLIFALFSFTLASHYFPLEAEDFTPTVYWSMGVITTIMVFVSVLIHELAHSLMAISKGIPIRKITLFIFGGVAQMEEEPQQPGTELKIALVGPATSLALGVIALGVYQLLPPNLPLSHVVGFLARINFVVGVINLIPAFPLDGGRVLRAGIWYFLKNMLRATRYAVIVGSIFAFFAIALGFFMIFQYALIWGIWYIFLGWLLFQAGQASYNQLVFHQALKGVPVKQIMSAEVQTVPLSLGLDKLVDHFYRYRFGAFPVTLHGDLKGLVTFHQLRNIPQEKWGTTTTAEIMTPLEKLITVSPDQDAVEVMMKMAAENEGRVIVIENNELVGILSRTDMMKLISMHMLLGTEK